MPRRSILSVAERESLLALPDARDELIRHYTFSEADLSLIRQRRGPANRLGFAVQLCYMRHPGVILGVDDEPFAPLLRLAASQLKVPVETWNDYGQREQTRREHLVELQAVFGPPETGLACFKFRILRRPQVEQHRTARLRERQVAQFIQDHQIDVHQPVCQLPGLVGVSSFSVQ